MASDRKGFAITISAADRVSGTIDKINKRIASMRAPAERVQKSLTRFAKLTGLSRVANGLRSVARTGMDAFRSVVRMIDPLAVITGAASIAGIVHLTMAWSRFGSQLGFTAQRIGVSAGTLMGLQGAAELAGSSAGSLTAGLQGLGQTLYDAAGGRNQEAVALFNQLGISWKSGALSARSVSDVLPQLADKIAAMRSPYAQAQAAAIAFGGAADDLLPFLRLGSRGIAQYVAMAKRYGVMNEAGVRAANDLRIAQTRVSLAVQGFTNTLAEKLAPILTPLLAQMAEWIAKNKEWIATKIGDAIKRVADFIKGIDWEKVGKTITKITTGISDLVSALGGWGPAVKLMLAAVGASWLAGILAPFATIAAAIAGITTALGLIPALAAAAGVGLAGVALAAAITPTETAKDDNYDVQDATPAQIKHYAPNAAAMRSFFGAKGMPDTGIAALFGNGVAESKLDPTATAPNGDYGIFQWGPDRQKLFAQVMGHDIHKSTLDEQFQFAWWELTKGAYKDVGDALRSGKPSVSDKTLLVEKRFEAPKVLDGPNGIGRRSLFANAYYNALHPPDNGTEKPILQPHPTSRAPLIGGPGYHGLGDNPFAAPATGQNSVMVPPDPQPAADLPSSVTEALTGLRTLQSQGKIDVNLRVKTDGKATATATAHASGSSVGKLRIEHSMPSAG